MANTKGAVTMDLRLNFKAYHKMYAFCQAAKGEVSAWGKTEIKGDTVRVLDVKLIEQDATVGTVDLKLDGLADFMYDLAISYPKDYTKWNFWFHTHTNFSVFWSGTDEANIQSHSQKMPLVSLVMNKQGDMLARIDLGGKRKNFDRIVVLPTGRAKLSGQYKRQVKRMVEHA